MAETTLECRGKRALVTGGTQGIGAAIGQRLTQAGATVMTATRRVPTDGSAPPLLVQADLSTAEGVASLARAALDRLGGVDILGNTLGGSASPAGGWAAVRRRPWPEDPDPKPFSG